MFKVVFEKAFGFKKKYTATEMIATPVKMKIACLFIGEVTL